MKKLTRSATQFLNKLSLFCLLGMSLTSALTYAESAPVYDVEELSQPAESLRGPQLAQAEDQQSPQQMIQGDGEQMPQSAMQNGEAVQYSQGQDDAGGAFVPMEAQAEPQPVPQNAARAEAQAPMIDNPSLPPEPTPMLQGTTTTASNAPLDQRINRSQQQLNNTLESSARMESLQNQVQSLRGQVEQLVHQLQQMQTQQKNQYSDLDKRLGEQMTQRIVAPATAHNTKPLTAAAPPAVAGTKLMPKLASATPAATGKGSTLANEKAANIATQLSNQPDVDEEQRIYQTAYNQIKDKKYPEAVHTLKSMLQKYPTGQFASNAHYWLGELYGVIGKNEQALNEFGIVVRTYPESPRVSDAQLKLGLIYAAQFKWGDAKNAFKRVINHYPGSNSARLASEQLKQIRQAGH